MTYQTKLIQEGSSRIFVEPFHCIPINIKMWWSIDPHGGSNEFIWWLIKLNSLKKVHDASLQNLSIESTFISRCGDQLTLMEDRMSLSNSLSIQTHWGRFVTHHYRNFPLFSHSYQSVVTRWGSKKTPQGRLISKQNPTEFISLISSLSAQWKPKRYTALIQCLRWLTERKQLAFKPNKKSLTTHHVERNSITSPTQTVVDKSIPNPLITEGLLKKNLRDLIPPSPPKSLTNSHLWNGKTIKKAIIVSQRNNHRSNLSR